MQSVEKIREDPHGAHLLIQVCVALGKADAACAALVLHGAGGVPGELRELGEALAQDGYRVLCPLLPGHGRDEMTLAESRFALKAVERLARALQVLRESGLRERHLVTPVAWQERTQHAVTVLRQGLPQLA